jgi:uncharacterized protein YggE
MRKRLIAVGMVAIIVAAAFLYFVAIPRIQVFGTGTVTAYPDEAQISFTVRTRDTLAASAVSKNAAIMNSVLAGLAAEGIGKDAINTVGYSLSPVYNQTTDYCKGDLCPLLPTPVGVTIGTVIGYETVQSLQVTVTDLPHVGSVLDKIVQAGVNQIDWISFTFKDATYNSLRAQAYQKAVQDAHGQAQAIVSALNGIIIGVASASTNYWGPVPYNAQKVSAGSVTPNAPVVPSGTIQVTATVNITYLYI